MRFGYTILYVPDVPAAVAFYEAAFGLHCRFLHESGMYAELETGMTALAFAHESMATANGLTIDNATPTKLAPPMEIAFVTDAPDAAYAHAVKHGASVIRPMEEKPWGQRVGHVRDLNGIVVEICSPMGG
ncbi:VOC family protein [Luteibacter flocculans]|uniref:VOC family protein n=2 Tax=Luteibacter flocculans TaxID=2780091 RepID=A0ABY4T8N2_9GAMM|nr:VOC family protein [Luteibacter flocculans]